MLARPMELLLTAEPEFLLIPAEAEFALGLKFKLGVEASLLFAASF